MPRFTERPVHDATKIIQDSGLGLGSITYNRAGRPVGTVNGQDPKEGMQVERGQKVSLEVEQGFNMTYSATEIFSPAIRKTLQDSPKRQ